MGNEETTPKEEVITEQVTNDETPAEVVESTEEQIQVDPLKLSPEQQSRHKSAADLEAFANQQQSEAAKFKNELDAYKIQHPTAGQVQPSTNEEVLDRLVKDPKGFVNELLAPIAAQVGLNNYANSGHPEIKDPNFMREMEAIINQNPALANDPKGLDMAYTYVKSQVDANKLTQAAEIKNAHNANVQTVKQTTAFVESSTSPKNQTSPKITSDMTTAEKDKVFDAQGVGWVKDEDREYD